MVQIQIFCFYSQLCMDKKHVVDGLLSGVHGYIIYNHTVVGSTSFLAVDCRPPYFLVELLVAVTFV